MTQHRRPIWLAVLLTPWAAPIGLVLAAMLFGLFTKGLGGLRMPEGTYFVLAYILPAGYTAMLVLGLPYVLWLRARGALTFLPVCAGAMIISVIVSTIYVLIRFRPTSLKIGDILIYALFGLLYGFVFCLIAGTTFRSSGRAKDPRAA